MTVEKITPDMFSNFKKINGFDGPYRNQYLKGIAIGPGPKKFETLEEAIEAACLNKRCGGITVSRQGYYTLRQKSNLYDSDLHHKFKSIEVTYVKQDGFPKPKPDKVVSVLEEYNIVEVEKVKSKTPEDTILEIVRFKNKELYYNISTRKLYTLKGVYYGKLEKGKLVS